MKYNPIEIYAIVCLGTLVLTVAVGWLILYIRDRVVARRIAEVERVRYIEKLRRERNFYRLQYQTRDILDKCEQTVAFERLLREAGK